MSRQYAREILPLHKADKNWRCKKNRFQFCIIREQCALYCIAGFKQPFSLINQKITGNLLEGDGIRVFFPEFEPEINNFFKDKNTCNYSNNKVKQHRGSISASRDPAALGSNSSVRRGKNVSVAEVNQQHCLEESGQWLENVDQTHQVLASSKQVLQKLKATAS